MLLDPRILVRLLAPRLIAAAVAGLALAATLAAPPASWAADDAHEGHASHEAHAELRARAVDTDQEVLRMEGIAPPMFTLRDPDGNSLILVESTG